MSKVIELSVGTNYVIDWTVSDAIREILQNAIDQETRDKSNKMTIDNAGGIVTISNKSSKLTKSSLVLGGTDKLNDDKTIGKFGEGYKLALLVLLRAGIEVVIHNHYEKEVWIPKLIMSKTFGVEVLAIEINKGWFTKPDNNLSFVLHGVEDLDNILKKLRLNTSNYEVVKTSYGDILIGKKPGDIYVNGLFVCHKKELKYSYSIKPQYLEVGRDRNLVNDWDICYRIAAMWAEVYVDYKSRILKDIESEVYDMKHFIYHQKTEYLGNGKYASSVGDDLYKQKFDGGVPVSSEAEIEIAVKNYGAKVKTFITSSQIVELTRDSITIKEKPSKSQKDLLAKFFEQHKKQFTKDMMKDWNQLK